MGKRNVYTMSDGTEYYAVDVTYVVPKPLVEFLKKYDNVNLTTAIQYAISMQFETPADLYDADGLGRLFAVKNNKSGETRTQFVTAGMMDYKDGEIYENEEFIDTYGNEAGNKTVNSFLHYPRPKWR